MLDMVYPALKTDRGREPCRRAGGKRPELQSIRAGAMMGTTLRRMGYFLTDGLERSGFRRYQGRERYYMVASVFPGFVPPKPEQSWWTIVAGDREAPRGLC